jgi:tetratricopeptide (TPR) repeat protein
MKQSTKIILIVILFALVPGIVGLQSKIDPMRPQFVVGKGVGAVMTKVENNPVVLPSQFVFGTLIGFREVVAGMLWVRCDDFFHEGNFEAIIPLIRIITWLDPHNMDVYCTGAWHMAYNFTDSRERADWRYLPSSIALLKEAIANNPGLSEPEHDLGFVIYQEKMYDFDKAAYYLKQATEKKDATPFYGRSLAHAYTSAGHFDLAERQWRRCIALGTQESKMFPRSFDAYIDMAVAKKNLAGFLMRRTQQADYSKYRVDCAYEVNFKRLGPRVFEISGKANLPNMSRLDLMLTDAGYKQPELTSFTSYSDPKATALAEIGMHGIVVRQGMFHRKYDLSKDLKQYPFAKDKYTLTVSFNPRENDEGVTDITGMCGERLGDKHYLDTSTKNLRKLTRVFHLTRKDII